MTLASYIVFLVLYSVLCLSKINQSLWKHAFKNEEEKSFGKSLRSQIWEPPEVNEGQDCDHGHNASYVNGTHETSEALTRFHENLKGFIYNSHYDYCRFEKKIGELSQTLSRVRVKVEQIHPVNEVLLAQHAFILHMFDVMAYSMQEMKIFDSMKRDRHYVYSMIETNVRLLGLLDSHGKLNRLNPKLIDDIYWFWRTMNQMNQEFYSVLEVSDDSYFMFIHQRDTAKRFIDSLWCQIPGASSSL